MSLPDSSLDNTMNLSNATTHHANAAESDPPVLLSPIGEVQQRSAQFYNFIWRPSFGGSVNQYELFIYEKVEGLADNQIVQVTAPVFRTKTMATSYLYTPADPILKVNQAYLVIVQVEDIQKRKDLQTKFKNNGKSKIETFTIVPSCAPGQPCDDGKECTYDDQIVMDCECKGTPYYDADKDGDCDPLRLPAPLIVAPVQGTIDRAQNSFVTIWKPQHDYQLDINYEFKVWQTGIEARETQEYQGLAALQTEAKKQFLAEQKKLEGDFYQQQQIQLKIFRAEQTSSLSECDEDLVTYQETFEKQIAQDATDFKTSLSNIEDDCGNDQAAANTIFQNQLKKEQTSFENIRANERARIEQQWNESLSVFQGKAQEERNNFLALQEKESEAYTTQLEEKELEDCGDQEDFAQVFEIEKKNLKQQLEECLAYTDDYKKKVKSEVRKNIKELEEEIDIYQLAKKLAKTEYEELVKKLEIEYKSKLKSTSGKAATDQINKEQEAAKTLLEKEYQTTLANLEQTIKNHQTEVERIKEKRGEDLANADENIKKLRRQCKADYRTALAALEGQLRGTEQNLDQCLELIQADANIFAEQQQELLADFEKKQAEQLQVFLQTQSKEKNDFQISENQLRDQFAAFQKERAKAFLKNTNNCTNLVNDEKSNHAQQVGAVKAWVNKNSENYNQHCLNVVSLSEADFLARQADAKALFIAKQNSERLQFELKQNERQKKLLDQLAKGATKKEVYTSRTKDLSLELKQLDFTLLEGYEYAIQVQAKDLNNVARFNNDGLSNWWPLVTTDGKPVEVLQAPVAKNAKGITATSFQANWTQVEGVSTYKLEVATDPNFDNILPHLSGLVVRGMEKECLGLYAEDHYYRLKSLKDAQESEWSNTVHSSYSNRGTGGRGPCEDEGTPCNDGDPCTINDQYDANCGCVGENSDSDDDGVCDGLDLCWGFDDNIDTDLDLVPDGCDDCIVGSSCNDGDTMTINDNWIINPNIDPNQPPPPGADYCLCQGTPRNQVLCRPFVDTDGDGVCDELDVCPGHNDYQDTDGDGIADGCDICPLGDNTVDTDEDGIPDACDEIPNGCNTTIALCPRDTVVTVCDYYYELPEIYDPKCYLYGFDVMIPGGQKEFLLSHATKGSGKYFDQYYCESTKGCSYTSTEALVKHLQEWMTANGYNGKVLLEQKTIKEPTNTEGGEVITDGKGGKGELSEQPTRGEVSEEDKYTERTVYRLAIKQTDVQFLNIRRNCYGRALSVPMIKEVCKDYTYYNLQPFLVGACESPTYQWSTGATSSYITVPVVDLNQYTVTITCQDGCTYTTAKGADYACVVGKPCNDNNPCTYDDVYTACCQCRGTYSGDEDGDGVCDLLDVCPGQDDTAMLDVNPEDGIPDSCIVVCDIGAPCNDGDICTVNDVFKLLEDGSCGCIGEGPFDEDGDFVCDPLDKCPGFPDFVDTDMDGIPDGCERSDEYICTDAQGNNLDYCGAIKAISQCLLQDDIPDEEQFLDMRDISKLFYDLVTLNPNILLEGDVTITGTGDGDLDDISIENLDVGDINNNTGISFNVGLLVNGNSMADADNDGVADLFDICHGKKDYIDVAPMDGIPDGCADCQGFGIPNPLTINPYSLGLYLEYKFDRTCKAAVSQPAGFPVCSVEGLYDCACNCEAEEAFDSDGDGVCDENDICFGGDDTLDADGDGIPNACDDEDPCESIPANELPECPAAGESCYIYAFLQYNDETGNCECVYVPDGDDDGDGVCNMLDVCEGFDDELDADLDSIPDACDLCPTFSGIIGQACTDNVDCTINDVIQYTYATLPLSEILAAHTSAYNSIPDPLNVQETVQHLEANGVPESIYNNLENTFETDGIYYGLMITGCECKGYEFDSDYDGVCDGMDACPGFDDNEDYDNDGIPDGCDPPYYEIGCPISIDFLIDGNYTGIILTWNDPNLVAEQIPSPVSFMFNKANGLTGLFLFENVPITSFQNLDNETIALYEIPDIDPNDIFQEQGQPSFLGEVAFSEGQFCYIKPTVAFHCQVDQYYVKDGFLAIGQAYNPWQLINRSSIPSVVSDIDLTFSGGLHLTTGGNITGNEFIEGEILLVTTDIPVSGYSSGLTLLENTNGTITFDDDAIPDSGNELTCDFANGANEIDCLNEYGNPVYIGQPCWDSNELTTEDRYVLNTETGECDCIGVIVHDQDGDGVHDEIDQCPGGDDNMDINENNIPDFCECTPPVIATQDFGDGVPVQMVKVKNGSDVEITLEEVLNGEGEPIHTSYTATWTPETTGGSTQPVTTDGLIINITGLNPGAIYTISITGTCAVGDNFESLPIEVEIEIPEGQCLEVEIPDFPEPCTDVTNLSVGEVVIIGDFGVAISEITSSGPGIFSGRGYTSLPYFDFILVEFVFTDIIIQECSDGEYYVVDGIMEVPQTGNLQDILDGFIGDFDPFDGNLLDDLESALEVLNGLVDEVEDYEDYFENVHDLATDVAGLLPEMPFMDTGLTDDLNDALDCMNNLPSPPSETAFNDCKDDLNTAIEELINHIQTLYDADYQVVFYPEDDPVYYGFDAQEYEIHKDNYEQLEIAGEAYSVPWKSVPSGTQVFVKAKRNSDDTEDISDIIFKDVEQNDVDAIDLTNGHQRINPIGIDKTGGIREVYAVQPVGVNETGHDHNTAAHIHIAGKLNVISYDEKELNVQLVRVNGVSTTLVPSELETYLDQVYGQAVVDANVNQNFIDINVPINDFDGVLDVIETGFLTRYIEEEKEVIRYFKNNVSGHPVDDTYYIFLVEASEQPGLKGHMPKAKGWGFVVVDNHDNSTNTDLSRTIAHELGHGAYTLGHTHEDEDNPELDEPSDSPNLMAYGSGTVLRKRQWDQIHDPKVHIGIFDEDSESQSVAAEQTLACTMPKNGYLLRKVSNDDWRGIYALKGTSIEFYRKLDDNYANGGSVARIARGTKVYKYFSNLAHFFSDEANGGGGVYAPPTAPEDMENQDFYVGTIESNEGQCQCIIFKVGLPVDLPINSMGLDFTETVSIGNAQAYLFPTNLNTTGPTTLQTVGNAAFCLDNNSMTSLNDYILADSPINGITEQKLNQYLGELPDFLENNGYNIKFLLYDKQSGEVTRVRKGSEGGVEGGIEGSIGLEILQNYADGETGNEDVVVYMDHDSETGKLRLDVKFKDGFLKPVDNPDLNKHDYDEEFFKEKMKEAILEKFEDVSTNLNEDVLKQSDGQGMVDDEGNPLEISPGDGNFVVKDASFWKWLGTIAEEGGYVIRNGELNPDSWDPTKEKYQHKIIVVPAPVAGGADEALRQLKDLYELFGMVKQTVNDPKGTVTGMYQYFSNMTEDDVMKLLGGDVLEQVTAYNAAEGVKKQYHGTRVIVITVATVVTAVKTVKIIKKMTKKSGKKGGGLRDFVDDLPENVKAKFDELPDGKKGKFYEDFGELESEDLLNAFENNPDLVDAWDKLDDANFSQTARRNLTNLNQRNIIDQNAPNISNASNARKGNFGEIGADLDMNANGYRSMQPRIDDIDSPGHNGIDGVYERNGQYFIVEGKYTGSASLNPANPDTGLPRQMSDAWITQNTRLADAVGSQAIANQIINTGYTRLLAKVTPEGTVTYKLVGPNGYLTGGGGDWTPTPPTP